MSRQPRRKVARSASPPAAYGSTSACASHAVTLAVAMIRRTSIQRGIFTKQGIPSCGASNEVRTGVGASWTSCFWSRHHDLLAHETPSVFGFTSISAAACAPLWRRYVSQSVARQHAARLARCAALATRPPGPASRADSDAGITPHHRTDGVASSRRRERLHGDMDRPFDNPAPDWRPECPD